MESRNFIIYTKDLALAERQITEILNHFPADTDILRRNIKDDSMSQILGELNTPSFLCSNKTIVINDGEDIFKLSEDMYNYFIKYLTNSAPFSVLIILFNNINHPNFSEIKDICVYYDLNNKKESAEEFVKKYFDSHGFTITEVALSLILDYGDNLIKLLNICDELMTYKYSDKTINDVDIREILEPPLENNVYDLCSAVIKRDSLKAYLIYEDLQKSSISITYLLGLIINKFEEMYNNNVLISNGYTQNDLAELYGVKIGRAYYMLQDAKNITINSIKRTLHKLYDLEYGIKKGSLNPSLAFSTYLLSL